MPTFAESAAVCMHASSAVPLQEHFGGKLPDAELEGALDDAAGG